jgi:pyrroline-5-carboxylate reductase
MFKSIGFIGGGRVVRIILSGLERQEKWPGEEEANIRNMYRTKLQGLYSKLKG